jgi:hypothetical protein
MDTVEKELQARGYEIKEEVYRSTSNGQIATGAYELNHNSDPELSLMFAWTNSYNKQVKFRAVTGAKILANDTYMILGEQGSWIRKHTGTADKEAEQSIIDQITHAHLYYNKLIEHKNKMKDTPLTTRSQANLLGVLFAEYNVLSSEQANYVKTQMKAPSYFYANGNDTLWAFYNHLTGAIAEAHPKTWLEDQRLVHYLITNEFNLIDPVPTNIVTAVTPQPEVEPIDPSQIDLLDSISEVEQEMANDSEYLEELDAQAERFKEEESLENLQAEKESEELIRNLDAEEDEDWDHMAPIIETPTPVEEETTEDVVDENDPDDLDEIVETEEEELTVLDEEETLTSVFGDEDDDDADFSFL